MSDLVGHCLCDAVRISADEKPKAVEICQCTMCRRWGGGFYAGISLQDPVIEGDADISRYRSSEWAERAFCRQCGSNLWFTFLPTGHRSFCAGLFEDLADAEIEKEIFCDSAVAWTTITGGHERQTGDQVIAAAEAEGFTFD